MAHTQTLLLSILSSFLWLTEVTAAGADQKDLAGPILQIHGGGPAGHITSVRFSPNGETLYAGGWDKAVWVWRKEGDQLRLDTNATFRVPIGPGLEGAINSIAISPDGQWLAVAGKGVFQGAAGFRDAGQMVPISAMEKPMRLDQGTIHVFDTRTRQSFQLRGHEGEVVGMSFARGNGVPILASAAREWNSKTGNHVGTVRLWSIQRRQQIDLLNDLPIPDGPPGIVVQRTGRQDNQVTVSLAWWARGAGSGVRFWNVARGQQDASSQEDYSRSLLWSGPEQISASFWRPQPTSPLKGVLRFWKQNGDRLVEDLNRRVDLVGGGRNFIPASLGVVRRNVLAITELGLVGNSLQADVARLRLVELAGNRRAKTLRTVNLWDVSDTPRLPIMDTSWDGGFVAVAGNPRGGVNLYRTANLLGENKEVNVQELRLPATRFEQISFVSHNGGLGLRLRRAEPNGNWSAGIFAFESRSLVPEETEDWRDASADVSRGLATADARPTTDNPRQTIQLRDGVNSLAVHLPPENMLTAAAVVDVESEPVWAIASASGGQPLLQLYNGRTGSPMRQLSGHEQRIRGLTFSRDGRWLASIEDGPQICVWSLADLDDSKDDGSLPGVVVIEGDRSGTLKVLDVGSNHVLQAGDIVLGYLAEGDLRPWPTARSFHDTWWATQPGDTLTLRVERAGQTRDLNVTAEPGSDERKPLFSLLVTPNPTADNESSWLAWSPLGAFDSSDRRIENLVGWHFNGTREEPSVYAALHQYRAQYYRPFLVRELIKTLKIPPRPRPSEPDISLWIPDSTLDPSAQANRVVRDREATAILNLDPTFPLDMIDSVTLKLNELPVGEFQLQADRTWQASLPDTAAAADAHRVRGVVKTTESPPREFLTELSYRVQPDAPAMPERPPLPLATVLPLKKSAERLGGSRVDVEVELDRLPTDGETVKLSINDEEVETPLEIVSAPGRAVIARATVTLDERKENRIQARTADDTISLISEPLIVPEAAPPTVGKIKRTAIPNTGFESWTVEVESASPSSQVFLDERELSSDDFRVTDMGDGLSEIVIDRVALPRTASALRIDNGRPVTIPEVPPATDATAAPPDVQLLGPSTVTVADTDRYTVEFLVRSPRRIDRVDVYNGKLVHRDSEIAMQKDSKGLYFVRKSVEVDLQAGLSTIEILARSAQGESSASLGVTRPAHPVTVFVDGFSLEPRDPISVKPAFGLNGRLTFQRSLPKGDVTLHGRIRWSDANDPQLRMNRSTVHIWVNGFQQLPVRLAAAKPGSLERGFSTPVVLNLDRANLIEIELSAAEVTSNPKRFYVDCQKPIPNRRLHLLVVSVDQSDSNPDALVDSAIEAFNGWRIENNDVDLRPSRAVFSTPAFQDGFVYGPLTASHLNRRLLHATVLQITRRIQVLNRRTPATDVILIYYRGAELINKPDGFYLTTAPTDDRDPEFARIIRDPINLEQFAVRSDLLNRLVDTNPGAYVLLLDVARVSNGAEARVSWPNDSRAAMLRYAWLAGLRVPEAARLLAGLQNVMPHSLSLSEVYQELEHNHAMLRVKFPQSASFQGYVPPILEELAMGTAQSLVTPSSP